MRVSNPQAMLWYLKEANEQMWSIRTLDRNIGSQYYERMLLTQHRDLVQKEMLEKTADWQTDKLEFIKNPVVAEFLGFSQNTDFTESDEEELRREIERQKEIYRLQQYESGKNS
jgi:predicted nuclease of restriction endonuclease-like (RecB) superfamily